jgi:hypothetical protein
MADEGDEPPRIVGERRLRHAIRNRMVDLGIHGSRFDSLPGMPEGHLSKFTGRCPVPQFKFCKGDASRCLHGFDPANVEAYSPHGWQRASGEPHPQAAQLSPAGRKLGDGAFSPRPLFNRKRTLVEHVGMSALCQKRAHALQQLIPAKKIPFYSSSRRD